MQYYSSRLDEWAEERLFRVYMTDIVKYQAEQKTLESRYVDLIVRKPVDTRSGDEIIGSIKDKLRKGAG